MSTLQYIQHLTPRQLAFMLIDVCVSCAAYFFLVGWLVGRSGAWRRIRETEAHRQWLRAHRSSTDALPQQPERTEGAGVNGRTEERQHERDVAQDDGDAAGHREHEELIEGNE